MQTPTTEQVKNSLQEGFDLLKTLRDEIRVELHLATMDAKAKWKEMEPRFEEAERRARELGDASMAAIGEAVQKLREFRDSLRQKH